MNCIQKITAFLLFFLVVIISVAQTERNLIPFSNKIISNPSYAGLHENESVWTGLQFYVENERNVYNLYSLTYDKFSHNLKGGLAFYFNQGLTGDVNINTTELGFAISRHFEVNKNVLIPSVNINFELANKHWYAEFIDQLLAKELQPPSPPGYEFGRFYRIKPRLGFLWDSPKFQAGFSAQFPFGSHLANEEITNQLNNPVFITHVIKKLSGKRKGLISLPFRAQPEMTALYTKNLFLLRLSLNVEEIKHYYSLFIQNNFTNNLHGIGGTFGLKLENIRISFSSGLSLPYISDEVAFYGEARIGVVIPPIPFSEKNPWAPVKRLF